MRRVSLQSLLRFSREAGVTTSCRWRLVDAIITRQLVGKSEIDEAGHGPFSQVGFSRILIS